MPYLIDGYNLLYAVGLLHQRAGPKALQGARGRLLGLLHGSLGDHSGDATVVFDSGRQAPNFPHEQQFHGVHIRFSRYPDKADDVIAQMIRHDSAPRRLTVVSDDHEVQRAARRRHCAVVGCVDFMAQLNRRREAPPPSDTSDKQTSLSEAELNSWLAEFADLEGSAEMEELCEPHDFLDFDPDEEKD
jgi:predicted RNA-binding protein with PIN domain